MAVPTAYLTSAKNVRSILEAMQRAGVPPKVTYEFLKQLGYPSSSDRPILAVLKALGFLTDSGEPTERYRRYKDPAHARKVLAEGIREAYADVFTVDQTAYRRGTNDLKGVFARLSDKGDSVNLKMATTFKTLADLADFSTAPAVEVSPELGGEPQPSDTAPEVRAQDAQAGVLSLRHDIHVHLPMSTDIAVYDAIFKSLRENLL